MVCSFARGCVRAAQHPDPAARPVDEVNNAAVRMYLSPSVGKSIKYIGGLVEHISEPVNVD